MPHNSLTGRIIIALDVHTREEALSLVRELPDAATFKVGLTLFASQGPSLLQKIQSQGKKIFLDLKLHDIPHQVAGAVRTGVGLGIHMMTLHASYNINSKLTKNWALPKTSAKQAW